TKVVSFKIWDTKLSASLDARAEYPSVIYSGDSQVADVTFVQGGVTPTLTVKANGNTLELKKDYTITYSNNKAVSTATKTAIATVKGKGKYAKSEPLQIPFNIVQDSIAGYKVVVADKTFSNKVNDYMSAPTVYDPNGKKLTAGRDYEKLTLDNYDYDGKTGVNDKPNTTTTVNVKIIGKGNYKDTAVGYYKLYDKSKAVSNFQVVIDDQTYTGQAVEPKLVSNKDAKGIHVYLTANDKKAKNDNASQFVTVVSYSNNINIGTAKVTLRGKGNYGGTKTVSYKIVKKQLKSIRVDKVVIKDKKNITKFYKGQGDASRKELIAYACPSDAENDTIVWTTSNKAVVRINKQWQVPVTDPSNVTGINEYHVEIESVGDGLVTIKAVSQDSGKADSISVDTRKKKTTGLSLSKSEVTLNAGESTTLSCAYTPSDAYIEDIVTSTSNFTVANAEVNISGNKINVTINARHGGVAYVMVTDKNSGASASCMVTVNEKYVEGNMIKVEGLQSGSSESAGNNNIRCFTNAFNKAKNQKPDERQSIYVPAGTYYITTRNSASTNGIQVCNLNNVSIVMDSGTVIKGIPCGENSSRVMWINECNGVSITGGTIIGDLGSHSGAGEQSHGIVAVQSSNICLRNMTVKSCAGDSLIITNNNNRNSGCSNIDVIGCTLGQSGRHCVSLTASKNINFKNCSIETGNAHGCIDIEANSGYSNEHIIFDGCTIRVGGGASIAIINSANDIRIINSRVSGGYIENRSGSNVFYNGVNIPTGDTWDP
ncbi:MAG: hypothetical protein KBT19_08095, partial [Lachnospiraceae bacterium]|nr:hypothetical protein [Candidatus Colinaster equi]